MANPVTVTAANNGYHLPLRNQAAPILDLTPDAHFIVGFFTEDANAYTITSNTHKIRQVDGTLANTFPISGAPALWVEFMFDTNLGQWEIVRHNLSSKTALNAASGGSGGSLPNGGTTNQVLAKASNNNGDVQWVSPSSGPIGPTPVLNFNPVVDVLDASATQGTLQDTVSQDGITHNIKLALPRGVPGTNAEGGGSGVPAGGTTGQILAKASNTDGDVTWIPQPTGGGGSGSGTGQRAEVQVSPDGSGNLTLNATLSNRFRCTLNQNVKLLNPVGFDTDQPIFITFQQDGTGNWKTGFDRQYLLALAQPYAPPLAAGSVFTLELRPTRVTGTLAWMVIAPIDKNTAGGYGFVTELLRIGATKFFTMADGFNALQNGQTLVVIRNGAHQEVTATKFGNAGETYTIAGDPVAANGSDARPVLQLGDTDFGNGGINRPSYQKAVLNFEGAGTFVVRDLHVWGAHSDGTARGIAPNGGCSLYLYNVDLYNNENGVLSGNSDYTGDIFIYDSFFNSNGTASNGLSHNIYGGRNNNHLYAERSSFVNAVNGHNFKCRTLYCTVKHCLIENSQNGREMEFPNGAQVLVEDTIIHKTSTSAQNDMVVMGDEGVRPEPTSYMYRRVRFVSDRAPGQDATFIWNMDDTTDVQVEDCQMVGDAVLANNATGPDGRTTVAGMRGRVHVYTTGGPVGPQGQSGFQAIAMTPNA